jgi:hypothetical protein
MSGSRVGFVGVRRGMQAGALLGLGSAAAFGAGDFVAGAASRSLSFWWVAGVSPVVSVCGAWVLAVVEGSSPTTTALAWALAAGVGAIVGATCLYRGHSHGQMAVSGPLSAVGTAALPALVW